MSEPQFRVAANVVQGGFRLKGQNSNGVGLWRNGGTYGDSRAALAEDAEHDSATLWVMRAALRNEGYELTSISDLDIVVGCHTSQSQDVEAIVQQVLKTLRIPLDLIRDTPRQ